MLIIIGCGLVALLFSLCSVAFTNRGRYVLGELFGILELASATVSSSVWAWALKGSGKTDWYLLGIRNYPPIGMIFWSMFIVGVLCILASICVPIIRAMKEAAEEKAASEPQV